MCLYKYIYIYARWYVSGYVARLLLHVTRSLNCLTCGPLAKLYHVARSPNCLTWPAQRNSLCLVRLVTHERDPQAPWAGKALCSLDGVWVGAPQLKPLAQFSYRYIYIYLNII